MVFQQSFNVLWEWGRTKKVETAAEGGELVGEGGERPTKKVTWKLKSVSCDVTRKLLFGAVALRPGPMFTLVLGFSTLSYRIL